MKRIAVLFLASMSAALADDCSQWLGKKLIRVGQSVRHQQVAMPWPAVIERRA